MALMPVINAKKTAWENRCEDVLFSPSSPVSLGFWFVVLVIHDYHKPVAICETLLSIRMFLYASSSRCRQVHVRSMVRLRINLEKLSKL